MFRQISRHLAKRSVAFPSSSRSTIGTMSTIRSYNKVNMSTSTNYGNISSMSTKKSVSMRQMTTRRDGSSMPTSLSQLESFSRQSAAFARASQFAKYPHVFLLMAALPFFGGSDDKKAAADTEKQTPPPGTSAQPPDSLGEQDEEGREPRARRPQGPARELPPVFFLIRRDLDNEERRPVLDIAINNPISELPFPDWDPAQAQDIITRIQARLVHAINRVSLCLDPLGQNLAMVNNCSEQLNQERQRHILPEFSLRTINTFQGRLLDRYERVMTIVPSTLSVDELKEMYDSLKEAEELCSFDTSLMYTVEQAIEKYHPRHPANFLLSSSRSQAEYFRTRRDEITAELKNEKPDLDQSAFDEELLRRLTQDQVQLGRQIHQRKISEQRRWIEHQHRQAEAERRRLRRELDDEEYGYDDDEYDDDYDDDDQPRRRRRRRRSAPPPRRRAAADDYEDDYEDERPAPRRAAPPARRAAPPSDRERDTQAV